MAYLGSWGIDDVLTFYANTTRFDTGAATDADAAPAYRVYEDETGTAILNGTMALLDSANTAGFYSEQITLSAANGFEAGKQYVIYKAATVNSVAGAASDTFQITAKVNTTHAAGTAWASGAITAASIATGAIDADAIADNAIDAGAIAAGAITSAKFAAGAIDAAAIATGAIDADALAADTITAAKVASDVGTEFADALLNRDMSTGTDSGSTTVRTVRQALRFLRNKWAISAGTLTVYKEDDATSSWTAAVTGTAGADPVTDVDPAGP